MDYPVVLERDDNKTILVSFPDFPEAHTFGDTETEALARAEDALATVVDAYIADRRSIPQPSAIIAKHYVTMPALMEAKIALYTSMRRAHVTKAELGRRLKLHPPQVDRLLAMHHGSRLDQIEKALRVLGQRLVVGVEAHSEPRRQRRRRIRVGGTRSRAAASDRNR